MRKLVVILMVLLFAVLVSADGVLIPSTFVESGTDGFVMTYHNVVITVEEGIAHVTIEEEFQNTSISVLEAMYVFPVPRSAVISDLVM